MNWLRAAADRAWSWTGSSSYGLLHGGLCVVKGLQEAWVRGGLISAQAGLLIDDKRFDHGCEGNSLVGLLDKANGGVSAEDLPDENAGEHKAGNNGQ